MKKLFLIFALIPLFMLCNCSDADQYSISYVQPSETEIMAKKLHEKLDGKNFGIVEAYVFNDQENRWVHQLGCEVFKIEEPYINICGTYYHLSNLVKFEIEGGLEFYFKF